MLSVVDVGIVRQSQSFCFFALQFFALQRSIEAPSKQRTFSRSTDWPQFRFNDKPSARLGKFSFQFSGCRVQNLEISCYSCDSFYSWFKIFAFFDKDVIHESNAVFDGLA